MTNINKLLFPDFFDSGRLQSKTMVSDYLDELCRTMVDDIKQDVKSEMVWAHPRLTTSLSSFKSGSFEMITQYDNLDKMSDTYLVNATPNIIKTICQSIGGIVITILAYHKTEKSIHYRVSLSYESRNDILEKKLEIIEKYSGCFINAFYKHENTVELSVSKPEYQVLLIDSNDIVEQFNDGLHRLPTHELPNIQIKNVEFGCDLSNGTFDYIKYSLNITFQSGSY